MGNRTRKEFAEYLKMDVKKLADKIRYQEKKLGKSFGQDFTDTKIYSEQEQLEICELLEIPIFRTPIHEELTKDILSEKQSEHLKNQLEQISELIALVDNTDFVKLDKNFDNHISMKLGEDFARWYALKQGHETFSSYEWDYIRIKDIAGYYFEKEKMSEK